MAFFEDTAQPRSGPILQAQALAISLDIPCGPASARQFDPYLSAGPSGSRRLPTPSAARFQPFAVCFPAAFSIFLTFVGQERITAV